MKEKPVSVEIREKCLECKACHEGCLIMTEIGESPKKLVERGIESREAFSCTLCGRCEALCPVGLSPMQLFSEARYQAVQKGDIDINEYRYLFPDRKNNLVNVYRKFYGIDYRDIEPAGDAPTCFFPGCTLLAYAPGLVRKTYGIIEEKFTGAAVLTECCGKPLTQLGVWERAEKAGKKLKKVLQDLNVKQLIVGCPGCFYELRDLLRDEDITMQTVYEVLDFPAAGINGGIRCTVHDSCPDRFAGVFGRQVRRVLAEYGYSLVEMAGSREKTICCGSGGMISHFRADMTRELVGRRLAEAAESGADILVGYCMSCVLKFAAKESGSTVEHLLSLLLKHREDFTGAKDKAAQMLEGPEGAKVWDKIMAD